MAPSGSLHRNPNACRPGRKPSMLALSVQPGGRSPCQLAGSRPIVSLVAGGQGTLVAEVGSCPPVGNPPARLRLPSPCRRQRSRVPCLRAKCDGGWLMFSGSIVALVTPFRDGAVDEAALEALVDWHVECGTNGLVPVGTTGESPTLSHEEHEKAVEIVVRKSAGRLPVIAGTGSNSTEEAIRFTRPRGGRRGGRSAGRGPVLQQADPFGSGASLYGASRMCRDTHHHLQHPGEKRRGHARGCHG